MLASTIAGDSAAQQGQVTRGQRPVQIVFLAKGVEAFFGRGLAQNLGALRALATEGIQCGHMRMHARTIAATAGAAPEEVPRVTTELVRRRDFSVETAREILRQQRS